MAAQENAQEKITPTSYKGQKWQQLRFDACVCRLPMAVWPVFGDGNGAEGWAGAMERVPANILRKKSCWKWLEFGVRVFIAMALTGPGATGKRPENGKGKFVCECWLQ